ncbi:MAG TPA: DUF2169 domain-containing protein [Gemmatimonadaceae bacterium]|nr:DUF2169 domain-containing protein [Gemmatimonadaceae bacterium]
MLQFVNETGLVGTIFLSPDPDGVDTAYAVVKGTFALGGLAEWGEPPPAAEQRPIVPAPEHHGDPLTTSIRVPSDLSLVKPATDVLLVGQAHAPGAWPVTQMDVALTVGPVRKQVRVVGDRVWAGNGVGVAMTAPTPFASMPLVWERAYGGTDQVAGAPRAEARNPVGTGFRDPESELAVEGTALPNLEDPRQPITSWKEQPPPAAFAPLGAHWEPRRSYAGTYDEAWQSSRAPYLPTDFDPRFLQLAPPDLIAPGYLQGGEPVEAVGVLPGGGVLRFRLPAVRITATFVLDGGLQVRPANLDTVLLEPDAGCVVLTWRAALAVDKQALRLREVRATASRAA